jgi:uncharacterized protein (DUF433 family)
MHYALATAHQVKRKTLKPRVARFLASVIRSLVVTLEHSPVSSSPKVLGGTLVFRGTRVPAQTLLDYLDDGFSLDEFLKFFPSVRPDDARDFLTLSRGAKS